MAAQKERTLRLMLGFYATRVRQLQKHIDKLERASTEMRAEEPEQKRIEVELDQARKELRSTVAELDKEITELEQAGNEQRIGQAELENLKMLREQLVSDEKSFQELETTFLDQIRAFGEYKGQVDHFVNNARQMRANLVSQGQKLNQDFVRQLRQDPGLGKSFVICCFIGVMYLLLASLLVYKFFDGFISTKGSNPLVDAFCMTFVTTFTIGYGDILPGEVFSKILCDALAVVGHVVPFIFCHYMDRIAQWWDKKITSTVESERLRLLYRVLSAIVVILVVIFSGVAGIYIFERDQPVISPSPSLPPAMAPSPTDMRTQSRFWDTFHLSVMTVTSTGYGDVSFVTVSGRSFAICWIPFSVTIYSVAIAYLTRHTLRAFRVHRYITGEH